MYWIECIESSVISPSCVLVKDTQCSIKRKVFRLWAVVLLRYLESPETISTNQAISALVTLKGICSVLASLCIVIVHILTHALIQNETFFPWYCDNNKLCPSLFIMCLCQTKLWIEKYLITFHGQNCIYNMHKLCMYIWQTKRNQTCEDNSFYTQHWWLVQLMNNSFVNMEHKNNAAWTQQLIILRRGFNIIIIARRAESSVFNHPTKRKLVQSSA